jgi:uncharacterized coiled-coil protein SlyX
MQVEVRLHEIEMSMEEQEDTIFLNAYSGNKKLDVECCKTLAVICSELTV